ncbi:unnamed protein product [Darwinula stevensoni]|uniref:Peptidase S1 domain-containing protein n=1 Tax=Darwinula stevensoni TaxID=69355 RepID=A0A7R8XAM5_9CRUS|nr:unnamed protein product [Darwinula stevensoni]CAG0891523.1 unnamed protein product [Darwinula stevensoni]
MVKFLVLALAFAWVNAAPNDFLRNKFNWRSDKPMPDGRIVGGEDAEIEQIPWQISFQTLSGFHFCGGSIMDSTHVITAAHCCEGEGPGTTNIRAGSNLNDQGGVLVLVADVLQHPRYNGNDLSYDICLLTLDEPLPLDGVTMKAVALPDQDQDYPGRVDVSVSGWGTLSPGGSSPDILQIVDVYTYTDDECNDAYDGDITPDMICAGVDEGGKDSCQFTELLRDGNRVVGKRWMRQRRGLNPILAFPIDTAETPFLITLTVRCNELKTNRWISGEHAEWVETSGLRACMGISCSRFLAVRDLPGAPVASMTFQTEIFLWESDKPMLDGRIVGGQDASIEDIPWQISFQFEVGVHFCGGSIMDELHIITAAHCCANKQPHEVQIRAGSNRKDEGGVIRYVEVIKQHEEFNLYGKLLPNWFRFSFYVYNDICLLTLTEPLPLDNVTMMPVTLPIQGQEYPSGTEVSASGWGKLTQGGDSPYILQVVDLHTYSDDECSQLQDGITDDMICAGVDEGGKETLHWESDKPMLDGRIVGGQDASIEDIPWQISFQFEVGVHFCGGSIMDELHIITAAHCCADKQPHEVQIRAGSNRKDEGGVIRYVEVIKQHEEFNYFYLYNDICILTLTEPLPLDNVTMMPVTLPLQGQEYPSGTEVSASGWGKLTQGGDSPYILQVVDLHTYSDDECSQFQDGITDDMICAGIDEGGKEIIQWVSDKPIPDGRSAGVDNANIEDILWQVSIQTRGGFHFCTGSIKDSTHIITAAHCCSGQSASNIRTFRIKCGSAQDRCYLSLTRYACKALPFKAVGKADGQGMRTSTLVDAYGSTLDNDICELTLATALPLDGVTIKAVTLPSQGQDYPSGTEASVSCWGTSSENIDVVDVHTYTNAECNQLFGGGITDDMICAGVDEGGEDVCQGRSGSPLCLRGGNRHLIGILSWGYGSSVPFPAVYTQISAFVNWLE